MAAIFKYPALRELPDRDASVLVEAWSVTFCNLEGAVFRLDIMPGFETDGASIPRFLWPFCGHPRRAPRIAAAVAHDWLYSSRAMSREDSDFVYAEISSALGIPEWRWIAEYLALRMFGWISWLDQRDKDTCRAIEYGQIRFITNQQQKGNQ